MTTNPASQISTPPTEAICLSTVTPEAVSWLWAHRIPRGKLTLLDGDPGLGKSTLTLAIAAAVSSGKPMPGESEGGPEGRVLLVCVEDGLQDTIVPRLKAAGANLANVYSFQTTTDLREDLGKLRACIEEHHIDFVVLDPLVALLGADANNDQRCRAVLTPLASVAAKTGAAILMVRHLTKAGSRMAIHRGGGSMGIIGAARSALLFTVDPNDPASRVLAVSKSNLGPLAPSLRLTFEQSDTGVAAFRFSGVVEQSADALLATSNEVEKRTVLSEAMQILRVALSAGPLPVCEVQESFKAAGVSWATARRAQMLLGIRAEKSAFDGGWVWRLPAAPTSPSDVDLVAVRKTHEPETEGALAHERLRSPS